MRSDPDLSRRLHGGALAFLWAVIALIFLAIGLQKLTAYEAAAVAPFASRSPFLAWAYDLLGPRGASMMFAAIEIPTGAGLAWGVLRPASPPARLGAAAAAATSFITLSFLFTAPGVLVEAHGLKLLSLKVGQLFFKDLALFAASLTLLTSGRSAPTGLGGASR